MGHRSRVRETKVETRPNVNENSKNLSVPTTPSAMPLRATISKGHEASIGANLMLMLRDIYPCESVSIRGPFFMANTRE
jgi:hypothetical protein